VSFATVATAQQNESQRIYNAINAQREKMSLPPLVYRIGEQLSVEERVNQISFNFALSEDCECDYESIAGDNSLQMLVSKMTNISRYQWLHFEEDARFAAIAVVKKEGIFYCVVRTYTN
jgi:hypothetical protein